jgi:D-3-phosphoglycerate dehydrogenase
VKVLITCMHLVRHFDKYRPQYEAMGVSAIIPPLEGQQFTAAEMAAHIKGMDAVIAGDDAIDAAVIDAGKASGLKAIIKWGIGTDGIDKPYAAKVGIPVFNTPGVFGEEVADLALSHLLMLVRRSHQMDAAVREGGWLKPEGRTLAGLTAGVIGLGSIGQAIVRRARAFGMTVVGSDVHAFSAAEQEKMGVRQMPLGDLLGQADVVFVASALTPESHHLLDRAAFAKMKAGAYVVNVSRGPLVEEAALVEALDQGRVAGAGLDVYEQEPLPATSALRKFADRCTFSTHNGSNTAEAVARINQMTTDILFDVLGLKPAAFVANRVA